MINVVDTETTGFDPKDGGVCEIACVPSPLIDNETWMQALVNPGCPIGYEAMGTHHITENMVADAPSLENVIQTFGLECHDVWAAHNAEFDRGFLPASIREKRWICTWRVALHLWPDAPSHKNQALRYWLNLDVTDMPEEAGKNAHRALYDAWVTAKLLQAELDTVKVRLRSEKVLGEDTPILLEQAVEELLRLTVAPVLLKKFRFGKHKDELVDTIDKGYLRWILKQSDMNNDVVHTAKHHLGMLL